MLFWHIATYNDWIKVISISITSNMYCFLVIKSFKILSLLVLLWFICMMIGFTRGYVICASLQPCYNIGTLPVWCGGKRGKILSLGLGIWYSGCCQLECLHLLWEWLPGFDSWFIRYCAPAEGAGPWHPCGKARLSSHLLGIWELNQLMVCLSLSPIYLESFLLLFKVWFVLLCLAYFF